MDNRISDFRRIRRMSLDDLAEASGLSKSTLSELERGMTHPMLDSARRIANALDAYEHEIWPEDATMSDYQKKCPIDGGTCGQGGTCYVCENEALGTELAAAKARIAELESLVSDIKAWDIDMASQTRINTGKALMFSLPIKIRERIQALLNKEPTND